MRRLVNSRVGFSCCAPSCRAAGSAAKRAASAKRKQPRQNNHKLPETTIESITSLDCRHFDRCPGCSIAEDLPHPPILREAQDYFRTSHQLPLPFHAGSIHGWRCRAKLAVRGRPGKPEVGLFQGGSHRVLPIPGCRTHHPRLEAAMELLRQLAAALRVPPYDEASGQGVLRYVQLTAVAQQQEREPRAEQDPDAAVQVVLVCNLPAAAVEAPHTTAAGAVVLALADLLWRYGRPPGSPPLVHSLWLNFHTEATNTLLGSQWKLLHGPPLAWQMFGGCRVALGAGSFVQANYGAMTHALRALTQHVPPGAALVDLYAGVGTIGMAVAAAVKLRSLKLVESNPSCREAFEATAAAWLVAAAQASNKRGASKSSSGLSGSGSGSFLDSSNPMVLEFHTSPAGASPAKWLQGATVVVLDPPRKGLDAPLLDALMRAHSPAVRDVVQCSAADAALQARVSASESAEPCRATSSPAPHPSDQSFFDHSPFNQRFFDQSPFDHSPFHQRSFDQTPFDRDPTDRPPTEGVLSHQTSPCLSLSPSPSPSPCHGAHPHDQPAHTQPSQLPPSPSPAPAASSSPQPTTGVPPLAPPADWQPPSGDRQPPPPPHQLLYLSCDFAAFRRDCEALTSAAGGWRLQHVQAFLFFPGTNSIETLAVFVPRR